MVKVYTKLKVYRYIKSNFIIRIICTFKNSESILYYYYPAAFLVEQSCQLPAWWLVHLLCPGEGVEAAPSFSDDSYCQASHLLASSWFLLSAHYCPLLTFLFCDVFEGYLLPELCNYTRCHLSPVKMCFHCELLEIISALCRYNRYLLHIDNMTKCSL